jgi:hypothetical protein
MKRLVVLVLLGGCANPDVTAAGADAPAPASVAGPDAGRFTFAVPSAPAAAPPAAQECGTETFTPARVPAELLLVLDRSGSMQERVSGAATNKWQDVTAGLTALMAQTGATTSWGLKLFPSGNTASTMCALDQGVEIPIAPGGADAITRALATTDYDHGHGGTPTRRAVDQAAAFAAAHPSRSPRYLVLVTDGKPTCGTPDPHAMIMLPDVDDVANALGSLRGAAAGALKTFVVGVAISPKETANLDQMALAGGMPRARTSPMFYPIASRDELLAALQAITTVAASCSFVLEDRPPDPDRVQVWLGDAQVPRGGGDGWRYSADMSAVDLQGAACDALKRGGLAVRLVFGCKPTLIQ